MKKYYFLVTDDSLVVAKIIFLPTVSVGSWDSAISIATDYGLDGRRFVV
jgi:hypothetical protein